MKLFCHFSLISAILVLTYGCATDDALKRSNRQFQQQLDAKTMETARYTDEQVNRISTSVNSMNETYSRLEGRVNELQRQTAAVVQQNQRLEQEIANLKKAFAAEQQARQTSIDKMAEQVAKETASAINSSRKAQAEAAAAAAPKGGPVGKGSFYEYTVQAGATLTTIAKAYSVQVSEIKEANSLKNDNIRVGQKLYIPKK